MRANADYATLEKKFKLKYVLDRFLALILMFLTAPIFLLAILFIKIDGWIHPENKGSIFYLEPRMSAGKMFNIMKFRTVKEETVKWIKEDIEGRSISGCADVTCAGQIILKWYMDELPQIINILKGEMTFVGPRPHIIRQTKREVDELGLTYRKYIKTGLLGVVQAWKRDRKYKDLFERMAKVHDSNFEAMNKLDALYANKCLKKTPLEILFFDIKLMIRGIGTVFKGVGR